MSRFGKILSSLTYLFLMLLGLLLFVVGFVISGFILTSELDSEFIQNVLTILNITDPKNSIVWFIASPFIVITIIGLCILLLTQRTANINRRLGEFYEEEDE